MKTADQPPFNHKTSALLCRNWVAAHVSVFDFPNVHNRSLGTQVGRWPISYHLRHIMQGLCLRSRSWVDVVAGWISSNILSRRNARFSHVHSSSSNLASGIKARAIARGLVWMFLGRSRVKTGQYARPRCKKGAGQSRSTAPR